MDEQHSTEGQPDQGSTDTEQSDSQPKASNDLLVQIGLIVLGLMGFVFVYRWLNRGAARDSAEAYWEAEREYNGRRLFGDAWDGGHGYN